MWLFVPTVPSSTRSPSAPASAGSTSASETLSPEQASTFARLVDALNDGGYVEDHSSGTLRLVAVEG